MLYPIALLVGLVRLKLYMQFPHIQFSVFYFQSYIFLVHMLIMVIHVAWLHLRSSYFKAALLHLIALFARLRLLGSY